jgi:hypothetical protein
MKEPILHRASASATEAELTLRVKLHFEPRRLTDGQPPSSFQAWASQSELIGNDVFPPN